MLVGLAFRVAVGTGVGGGVAVTVTVAGSVVEPVALVATSEYVAVAVGETVRVPLRPTETPSRVTVTAFEVVHVSVDVCPV